MTEISVPVCEGVVFKQVKEFEGRYAVGDDGSLWTCRKGNSKKTWPWRRLRLSTGPDGYVQVSLCREGFQRNVRMHTVVLEAFAGPCPEGMEACHDPDHTRTNNRANNLRWGTKKENFEDRTKHGRDTHGERNGMSKLTSLQVREIVRLLEETSLSHSAIASKFSTTRENVRDIGLHRRWPTLLNSIGRTGKIVRPTKMAGETNGRTNSVAGVGCKLPEATA